MEAPAVDALVGRELDRRYVVLSRIAHGGMATVYAAEDRRLDRPVAVKVMHPALAADPAFVERFTREARNAARINHVNVVAVHDQGTDAATGAVFLVMELVRGVTLRELLHARGRLTATEALEILEPVASALAAAHAVGLVHRDIKPENVLLGDDGRARVADFGLARAVEASPLTAAAGLLIGTVGYLAPEQVSSGAADARTDVYAAGILLWEMLVGRPPYDAETPLAVAYRHLHEDVPAPGVDPAVDALVLSMTRRDPAGRPADGAALVTAVRDVRRRLDSTGRRATAPLSVRPRPTQALVVSPAAPTMALAPVAAVAPVPVTGQPQFVPSPGWPDRPRRQTAVQPAPYPGRTTAPPALARRRRRRTSFLVTLALLLVTAAAAAGGWWLGYGRWTHAPSFVSLAPDKAKALATQQGFSASFVDPVSSETVPAGEVAEQDPAPGASTTRGGRISLHLSLGPQLHSVPVVARGTAPSRAATLLHDAGLGVGATVGEYDATLPAGQVLRTDPIAGTRLPTHRTVQLVVSKGPAPIPVPQLVGLARADAEAVAGTAKVTLTETDVFSDTVADGTVVSQSAPPGSAIQSGGSVVLEISKGAELVRVPGVGGSSVGTAKRELEALGLVAKEHTTDLFGFGLVVGQDIPKGAMVPPGTVVTIDIV